MKDGYQHNCGPVNLRTTIALMFVLGVMTVAAAEC